MIAQMKLPHSRVGYEIESYVRLNTNQICKAQELAALIDLHHYCDGNLLNS